MTDQIRAAIAKRLYEAHEGIGGDGWDDLVTTYPALVPAWLRAADEMIAMVAEIAAGLTALKDDES